jgi:HK97 family phage major capsid protein
MLKAKLETKRAELEELSNSEQFKAGDAETVASVKSLVAEIDGIKEAIEVATKSNDILASMKGEASAPTAEFKSVGALAADAIVKAGWKKGFHPGGGVQAPEFKAGEVPASPVSYNTTLTGYTQNVDRPGIISDPKDDLVFAQLFNTEQLAGTSLTYVRDLGLVGSADVVAEGGQKPQVSNQWDKVTVNIEKLAAIWKMSDEFFDDTPMMVNNINANARYNLGAKEEERLVTKLLADTDVQTYEYDASVDNALAEAIYHAITLISVNAKRNANAVVINPYDAEALRLSKDGNGQYLGGGFFQGQYGNGAGLQKLPPIWGVPMYASTSVEQGTVIVGDFTGASVLRHGGVKFAMTDSDGDDFGSDILTCRLEERVGMAIFYPKAFCVVTAESVNP